MATKTQYLPVEAAVNVHSVKKRLRDDASSTPTAVASRTPLLSDVSSDLRPREPPRDRHVRDVVQSRDQDAPAHQPDERPRGHRYQSMLHSHERSREPNHHQQQHTSPHDGPFERPAHGLRVQPEERDDYSHSARRHAQVEQTRDRYQRDDRTREPSARDSRAPVAASAELRVRDRPGATGFSSSSSSDSSVRTPSTTSVRVQLARSMTERPRCL